VSYLVQVCFVFNDLYLVDFVIVCLVILHTANG